MFHSWRFQLAWRIFSFQVSIILLQCSPLSCLIIIRWSQLEKWKCSSLMEKSHQSPQGMKNTISFYILTAYTIVFYSIRLDMVQDKQQMNVHQQWLQCLFKVYWGVLFKLLWLVWYLQKCLDLNRGKNSTCYNIEEFGPYDPTTTYFLPCI